jgi:hypothetical protein
MLLGGIVYQVKSILNQTGGDRNTRVFVTHNTSLAASKKQPSAKKLDFRQGALALNNVWSDCRP